MNPQPGLDITISAFGEFGNIKHNPTSILVNSLTADVLKKYRVVSAKVLEVSTVACEEYINSLSPDTLNLHFGVYDGSDNF